MEQRYENWQLLLNKEIVDSLQDMDFETKKQLFTDNLEFGTAGMRAVMGVGTNRMNVVNIAKLAKAFCETVAEENEISVTICYDARENSNDFARVFAKVLILNNVKVYLAKTAMPTPICCYAGSKVFNTDYSIMITASHNPKEYNGIKLYSHSGVFIDKKLQERIRKNYIKVNEVEAYNECVDVNLKKAKIFTNKDVAGFVDVAKNKKTNNLKITYTALHGVGYNWVRYILEQSGFNIDSVKNQEKPNGKFPTCSYPNPEFEKAFEQSLIVANKKQSDIIIATDPDADRLAVMCYHNNDFVKLNGDELGLIFLEDSILNNNSKNKFALCSVVTSPLCETICRKNKVKLYKTLTGFLNLGNKMEDVLKTKQKSDFVISYEESCGYVVNANYFDKDSIYASKKICEIAQQLKNKNKTLVDFLEQIYEKYGAVASDSFAIEFEGDDSIDKMEKTVGILRRKNVKKILGEKVTEVEDYLTKGPSLKQNFLHFKFDSFSFIVRPSGTEPKLKVYMFAKESCIQNAKNKLVFLKKEINEIVLKVASKVK